MSLTHLDAGVDDAAAVSGRERDDRIQIQFDDLGHFHGESRHAQQQLAQGVEIGRRMAAVAFQQRKPSDAVQQLVRVAIGQRRDAST